MMNQLAIYSVHFFDTICRQKSQKSRRFGHNTDAVVVRAGKNNKTVKHTIYDGNSTSLEIRNNCLVKLTMFDKDEALAKSSPPN